MSSAPPLKVPTQRYSDTIRYNGVEGEVRNEKQVQMDLHVEMEISQWSGIEE
jgi:hypothetical protein